MKLTVQSFCPHLGCHVCADEAGQTHRVDLAIDNAAVLQGNDPEWLVGRDVEVEYLLPYLSIGMGVTLAKLEGGAS